MISGLATGKHSPLPTIRAAAHSDPRGSGPDRPLHVPVAVAPGAVRVGGVHRADGLAGRYLLGIVGHAVEPARAVTVGRDSPPPPVRRPGHPPGVAALAAGPLELARLPGKTHSPIVHPSGAWARRPGAARRLRSSRAILGICPTGS